MATIPKRVEERLIAGLKKFQTVPNTATERDGNESDLVASLNGIYAEVLSYQLDSNRIRPANETWAHQP